MNKIKAMIPVFAVLLIATMTCNVAAVTRNEAKIAGYGFHEPGNDWWDNEYMYRLPINMTRLSYADVNLVKATVDFSDYFSQGTNIIDIATMQLIHFDGISSIPVKFQVETDAVDIWNPPTVPEIEIAVLGEVLAENGTFVGTVYNAFGGGSPVMNQSIRFQVDLDHVIDKLKFQFVYQPELELNVVDTDYLEFYAGIPGNWSAPVRVYRRDLPDTKSWTDYITIDMPVKGMDGIIWVNIQAPTLYGSVKRWFSIDFVFVDCNGFNGKKVIHFIPEAEGIEKISQSNYYPRVQVLETEMLPTCDVYTYADFAGPASLYYLYFNFMNESNHRPVDNDAVRFLGELNAPQNFVSFENEFGTIIIDTNKQNTDGSFKTQKTIKYSYGTLFDVGIQASDVGFSITKKFGQLFTTLIVKNSTTTVTYTAYEGKKSLDVKITSTVPVKITSAITLPMFLANDITIHDISPDGFSTTFTPHYISIFDAENETTVLVAFNESMTCSVNTPSPDPITSEVKFTCDGNAMFMIMLWNASAGHDVDPDAIVTENGDKHDAFDERKDGIASILLGTRVDRFVSMQLFFLNDQPLLDFAYDGYEMQFALFGHSLQSMSINIDGKTGDIGINGRYIVNVAILGRTLIDRHHVIVVTGRNEFSQSIQVQVSLWIANDILDAPWTLLLELFTSIFTWFASIGAVLTGVLFVQNKKRLKKAKLCIGDRCTVPRE